MVGQCSTAYLLNVRCKEMLSRNGFGLECLGALLATGGNLPTAAISARVDTLAGALAFDRAVGIVQTANAAEVVGEATAHVAQEVCVLCGVG